MIGCGDSVSLNQPISGTVTIDGTPIESGSISFLPERGTDGPAATTTISSGKYQFTNANGPYTGGHQVMIGADLAAQPSTPSAGSIQSNSSGSTAETFDPKKRRTASPIDPKLKDPRQPQSMPSESTPPQSNQQTPPAASTPLQPKRNWETRCDVPGSDGTMIQNFDLNSKQDPTE